jgi:hypothetical protein
MPDPNSPRLLTSAGVKQLTDRLMGFKAVRRFDDSQLEAPAIADALSDLETVFRKYLDQLLPRLLSAPSDEALEEALDEIRLEFLEVIWHLWYSKYFRSLLLGDASTPPSIDIRLRP